MPKKIEYVPPPVDPPSDALVAAAHVIHELAEELKTERERARWVAMQEKTLRHTNGDGECRDASTVREWLANRSYIAAHVAEVRRLEAELIEAERSFLALEGLNLDSVVLPPKQTVETEGLPNERT